MNTLEERSNNLGYVYYEQLLKVVLDVLKRSPDIFHAASGNLTIGIDGVAMAAVKRITASGSAMPFENTFGTRNASVNFADVEARKQFTMQIEQIRDQLLSCLDTELKSKLQGFSVTHYVLNLLREVSSFRSKTSAGLQYPFSPQTLQEERLRLLPRTTGVVPWLKGHKLTISIRNISEFDTQLVKGISRHLEDTCEECSQEDLESAREILERDTQVPHSELNRLKRVISRESLGRLQKEAKIRYLEFLSEGIKQWKAADKESFSLLQNMIKRLRLLEAYIHDPNKPDGHYLVNYGGFTVNYRDLFSRADALDTLPIISEIEGVLGETFDKDRGEQAFTSGIKLKLNGPVQTHKGEPVFDYYLTLLDPNSDEHKERKSNPLFNNQRFIEKVLKVALLYYFVFLEIQKDRSDLGTLFEKRALPALQGQEEGPKIDALGKIAAYLRKGEIKASIEKLKQLLKQYISNASTGPERREYPIHLSLKRGILEQDSSAMLMERKFFQDVLNERSLEALKYLSIEEATAGGSGFCTLPVSIIFEPLYYFSAQEPVRTFTMEYDIQGFDMLPVLLVPNDERCKTICDRFYGAHNRIVLPYQPILPFKSDSPQAFVYRFTFLLLAYTCLKALLDSIRVGEHKYQRSIFVPIVRLHALQRVEREDISNEGSIIRSLSKVLSHMLAEEYHSNSQGFSVDDLDSKTRQSGSTYKLSNGLSSLYSALPKNFLLDVPTLTSTRADSPDSHVTPRLDKLAIVVVSSRKSDFNVNASSHIANVFGEVIGIELSLLTRIREACTGCQRRSAMKSKSATGEDIGTFCTWQGLPTPAHCT